MKLPKMPEMPEMPKMPTMPEMQELPEPDYEEIFWEGTFHAALSGILANPDTKVASVEANVSRAGSYADACRALYNQRQQGKG